jgi:hypothetical protein
LFIQSKTKHDRSSASCAGVGHQPSSLIWSLKWPPILTDLKNMAVCPVWNKQDFNCQKHIFGKSRFTQWALKQFLFEEMRRIDLLWKIVEYMASLLWMINVYEFCCFNLLRKTCIAFLFNDNEDVLKSAKLPC